MPMDEHDSSLHKPAPTVLEVEATARSLTANSTVKSYVIAAVGASIIPVPLVDIAAVVGIQLRMIQKLAQLYGKPFSETAGRSVIASLAGGVLGYGAGMTVAVSLTKVIPGVGWMLGMASLPAVAGATTYAIGRAFIKHFDEGGSMLDFSPSKSDAYYREQFEIGKQHAARAAAELRARKVEQELSRSAA